MLANPVKPGRSPTSMCMPHAETGIAALQAILLSAKLISPNTPHFAAMTPRLATIACLLCLIGCKATHDNAEMDALLDTVSYETTVPAATPPVSTTAKSDLSVADSGARIAEKAGSLGQAVVDGLKVTAGVLLYGVFKVVESALGFDDDDDDDFTPRGRADQNFNQWLDLRDRWRRDESP